MKQMQPRFDRINANVKAKRYADAAADLEEVMNAPAFDRLPGFTRHQVLTAAGSVQIELQHPTVALAIFRQAQEMPEATAQDWFGEADAARMLRDRPGKIAALTHAGRRRPEALRELKPELVDVAIDESEELPDVEARIEF